MLDLTYILSYQFRQVLATIQIMLKQPLRDFKMDIMTVCMGKVMGQLQYRRRI
jgi:hypothetical protein